MFKYIKILKYLKKVKTIIENLKILNSILSNRNILIQSNKIKELVKNYSDTKNKINDYFFQNYQELFFSSKELDNINIIKLVKTGTYSKRHNECWTQV